MVQMNQSLQKSFAKLPGISMLVANMLYDVKRVLIYYMDKFLLDFFISTSYHCNRIMVRALKRHSSHARVL